MSTCVQDLCKFAKNKFNLKIVKSLKKKKNCFEIMIVNLSFQYKCAESGKQYFFLKILVDIKIISEQSSFRPYYEEYYASFVFFKKIGVWYYFYYSHITYI